MTKEDDWQDVNRRLSWGGWAAATAIVVSTLATTIFGEALGRPLALFILVGLFLWDRYYRHKNSVEGRR